MSNAPKTTVRRSVRRRYARRTALLIAVTVTLALATRLGGAFSDGYRSQASGSGEFTH